MKNYKYLLLVSTCLLFNNNSQAMELDLTFNPNHSSFRIHTSDTHTPVELKPISNSNKGVKLAAVCALANGGCDGLGFSKSDNDMNLDNAAQCREDGFGTTCSSGYVPDTSQKCPYNDSFFKCRACSNSCPSGSLTYCSDNQVETGNSKNDCGETCYTCSAKTCEEGGYASSITSCQKATTINFAGKTCYKSIVNKTCSDGGYFSSAPTNQSCSSTSYCGNTCYHNCSTPACSVGGFQDSIPTDNVCTSTTYYGTTCYKDCYKPNCGAGGYNASIPSNNICTSVNYYGTTCYHNCYTPSCTAGGYVNSCPANQVGTTVNYYGQTCYSGCGQPSCSAGGYEASIPSGKNCTSVSYYGRTCYKDCVNSCVPKSCSGYSYTNSSNEGVAASASCTITSSDCSTGKTLYKAVGCYSNYTLIDGICIKQNCITACNDQNVAGALHDYIGYNESVNETTTDCKYWYSNTTFAFSKKICGSDKYCQICKCNTGYIWNSDSSSRRCIK